MVDWSKPEEVKEYQKNYRETHKEKAKEYHKNYRENHKEEIKARQKKHYETHKEERKATGKKYRETHKEEIKEYGKNYYETHKEERKRYLETRKEEIRAYSREYDAKYLIRKFYKYVGVCLCPKCGLKGYKSYLRIYNKKTGNSNIFTRVNHQHGEDGKTVYDGYCFIGMGEL